MRLFDFKYISNSFYLLFESKQSWIVDKLGIQLIQASSRLEPHPIMDADQIVLELSKADPTSGKYLVFLANMYANQQFKLKDVDRIKSALLIFDKVKSKLTNGDIMTYHNISDVFSAVEPFRSSSVKTLSNKEQKRYLKTEGADFIINTPDFKVIQPLTKEAACLYGAGTKWCTSASQDNKFAAYNANGAIYIIIAGKRKYQMHYFSDRFTNELDKDVTSTDIALLSKYPQYKQFLNILIHKYYGL